MDRILSWNKEYYKDEDGCWCCIDGEFKDVEVDLPSNHCDDCGYAGEHGPNHGEGIEEVYRQDYDDGCYAAIHKCFKCNKLYVDFQAPNGTGWWDSFDGRHLGLFLDVK